jgi:Amt family ammonium transporter
MVPFFSMADGGEAGEDQGGIFVYGDHSYAWKRLGINLLGVLAIALWSILWSVIIFGGLKKLKLLRIDHETERLGNDGVKHGESAYPMDAWVLAQVKDSL